MKKYLVTLLCLSVMLLAASAMAYDAGTGINGTPHDLATGSYAANPDDSLDRICIYCHTPHHAYRLADGNAADADVSLGSGPQAADEFTYLPLWNHDLQTDLSYAMYDNGPGAPTLGSKASQAIINGSAPGSMSLLCLSCHDGSVAVNAYGNAPQSASSISDGGGLTIAGSAQIGLGTYLGNHHPIGFDYDAAQWDDIEIRPADGTVIAGLDGTDIRAHLYGSGNTMMECGTCHSVHNTGNTGETFLWRSDQNSELCLTCHAKGTYTAP